MTSKSGYRTENAGKQQALVQGWNCRIRRTAAIKNQLRQSQIVIKENTFYLV
ncbi:hypothetical protein ACWJJH_13680 [Endozoicomonadaceae bacterium StTr2]